MAINKLQYNLRILFENLRSANKYCIDESKTKEYSWNRVYVKKEEPDTKSLIPALTSNSTLFSSTNPGVNAILQECEINSNIDKQPPSCSSWDRRYPKK